MRYRTILFSVLFGLLSCVAFAELSLEDEKLIKNFKEAYRVDDEKKIDQYWEKINLRPKLQSYLKEKDKSTYIKFDSWGLVKRTKDLRNKTPDFLILSDPDLDSGPSIGTGGGRLSNREQVMSNPNQNRLPNQQLIQQRLNQDSVPNSVIVDRNPNNRNKTSLQDYLRRERKNKW